MLLAAVAPLAGAEADALAPAKAFFAPEGIENKAAVYTGEMLRTVNQKTMDEYFGVGVQKEYRLLQSDSGSAIYAVGVKTVPGGQDWYAYVRLAEGSWKLEAVRTLAQTGMIRMSVQSWRDLPAQLRTPEREWQQRNAQLVLSTDYELKAHLVANLKAFEALAGLAVAGQQAEVKRAAKELLLQGVRT